MVERTSTDGKPFYCAVCGAGYGEYAACEEVDCRLESIDEAQKRKPPTVPEIQRHLRGKNLACWCRLCPRHEKTGLPLGETCGDCEPCHAAVLLEIANR